MAENLENQNRSFTYSGKAFVTMINKYFMYNINKRRNLTFIEIDPKCLYLQIDDIGGKDIYPFSKNHNMLVNYKFELEPDMHYHVYFEDLAAFNEMTKEQQLEYLDNMKKDDLCIGHIEDTVLLNWLRSYIKTNVNYTGVVKESNELTDHFWWHIDQEFDDMKLAVYVNYLSNAGYKMKVEVNYDLTRKKKESKYASRMANNVIKFVEDDLLSTGLFTTTDSQWDARQYRYSYKFVVRAKDILNDDGRSTYLFTIQIYPIYPREYLRICINKDLADELGIDKLYSKNAFDASINDIKQKLNTLSSNFEKKPEFLKIAKVFKEL